MEPAITFECVHLAHGSTTVLDDVELALPAGHVTALIGPNGSGKSTLLSAMAGLLPPAAGIVQVLGGAPLERRGRIAYVLQQTRSDDLLPITVGEVVTMGRYARRGMFGRLRSSDHQAVLRALARMDIVDLADRQLRRLSGGQRQRALVAQGLVQEAEVLLLDEPVTGLDLVSQQLIIRAVTAERDAGRTVVLSTHDLKEADRADHVVLLTRGRVVSSDIPAQALAPRHLRAAYGRQLVQIGEEESMVDEDVHHLGHEHPHR